MSALQDIAEAIGDYTKFVRVALQSMRVAGIEEKDYRGCPIDHLCYRTVTSDEYQVMQCSLRSFSKTLTVTSHNGRDFTIFCLRRPLRVGTYKIWVIELPSPKRQPDYPSGLEHLEMVVPLDRFFDFAQKYAGVWLDDDSIKSINPTVVFRSGPVTVRFHTSPLDELVVLEGHQFLPVQA